MHPEEFLQRKKEQEERKKRRMKVACIIVCAVWIPIALFIYKPTLLFGGDGLSGSSDQAPPEEGEQSGTADDTE